MAKTKTNWGNSEAPITPKPLQGLKHLVVSTSQRAFSSNHPKTLTGIETGDVDEGVQPGEKAPITPKPLQGLKRLVVGPAHTHNVHSACGSNHPKTLTGIETRWC